MLDSGKEADRETYEKDTGRFVDTFKMNLKCPCCDYEHEMAFDMWFHLYKSHSHEEVSRDLVYNILVKEREIEKEKRQALIDEVHREYDPHKKRDTDEDNQVSKR